MRARRARRRPSRRALGAYRLALARLRPLLGAIAVARRAGILLPTSVVLLPIAMWLIVRWSLLAPVVELEDRRRARGAAPERRARPPTLAACRHARRPREPCRAAAGPLLGALLIFVSDAPLALLNLVAGIVYALALPFVALVTAYVYFDARVREELEPRDVRRRPACRDLDPLRLRALEQSSPGGAAACGRRVEASPFRPQFAEVSSRRPSVD